MILYFQILLKFSIGHYLKRMCILYFQFTQFIIYQTFILHQLWYLGHSILIYFFVHLINDTLER